MRRSGRKIGGKKEKKNKKWKRNSGTLIRTSTIKLKWCYGIVVGGRINRSK